MSTLLTTVSGREVDLFDPKAEDIDFSDIAEQLAKEPRYNGATPGKIYSVAEHSVRGAAAILAYPALAGTATAADAAAYFLCHDFHEAYLKDDTTPKKRALDRVAQDFGALAGVISEAYARLTERFDRAIHEAAGLSWPPPPVVAQLVHRFDRAMLVTEWRELRPGHPLPPGYEDVEPLKISIEPWGWERARGALEVHMQQLLPACAQEQKLRLARAM